MMPGRLAPMLCIGVGNEYRSDDGVGIAVARILRASQLPGVQVMGMNGEGAGLMAAWADRELVILIDAVASGGRPGTVYRLDAHHETIPTEFFHYSTHAFSVAEAVEMARILGNLPARIVIYGVEGDTYASGVGLSPAVARAVPEVVGRIIEEMKELTKKRTQFG